MSQLAAYAAVLAGLIVCGLLLRLAIALLPRARWCRRVHLRWRWSGVRCARCRAPVPQGVDVSVVMQRQLAGCLRGVEEFHTFPARSLALSPRGHWTLFLQAFVSGKHLARCSHVSLRMLLQEFHFISLWLRLSRSHMEIWTLLLRSLWQGSFRAMPG